MSTRTSTAVTRLVKGQYAVVQELRPCDFCRMAGYRPVRQARYDFRSTGGQWGYGCRQHYFEHRLHPRLGVGMGQRLYLPGELPTPTDDPRSAPGLLNPRGVPSHASDV